MHSLNFINSFNKRLFVLLFLSFILATVIGTVSHESGHYFVAKSFGYHAEINYAYAYWEPVNPNEAENPEHAFLITLGGPLMTMLTGTLGFIFLLILYKSFFKAEELNARQWFLIFISLFWLRQIANFFIGFGVYVVKGNLSSNSDEVELANYLQLPHWSISFLTAIIGGFILAVIIFKFIPAKQRFTFIISGLTGGISGYFLWLVFLGKYIMP